MKKLHFFVLLFASTITFAQTFPYDRIWGTYVGGGGTQVFNSANNNAFILTNQNNVFLNARTIDTNSAYPASYFNQFAVSSGGYPFVNNDQNRFSAEFSTDGTQLYGAYKGAVTGEYEDLLAIDNLGNKYIAKVQTGLIANLATAGAWLTDYSSTYLANGASKTYTLSKYDNSGNLIYTTYLPNANSISCLVQGDSVFVLGQTNQQIPGLSTVGVFQENYNNYNGLNFTNGYYVKLSATGSKQLGTYLPSTFLAKLHNGGLYFWGGILDNQASVIPSLVTPGTFQQSGGKEVLFKFNANTATLIWGTTIGVNNSNAYYTTVYNFGVNETGIYLYGIADNVIAGYYATPNAFKTQITGDNDLFLTKFDDTGNRIWGTYLGGNGEEDILGSGTVALKGNKIVVAGNTWSANTFSTPGAFQVTPANASAAGNMFFTGFDSNGNQEFCSYFGGISGNSEQINPSFDTVGNLYLWGNTTSSTNIATANGAYSSLTNPLPNMPFGFLVKFSPKDTELAVSEAEIKKDIVLYDNPNNGNFKLSGNILEKELCKVKIYDSAGRLISSHILKKNKVQNFELSGVLSKGFYLVNVLNEKENKIKVFKMTVK
jgi:hypothetical protein